MTRRPIKSDQLNAAIIALLKHTVVLCEKYHNSRYSVWRKSMNVKDDDALFCKLVGIADGYKWCETTCKAFILGICKVTFTNFTQFNIIKKLINKMDHYATSLSIRMKKLKQELEKNRIRSCS